MHKPEHQRRFPLTERFWHQPQAVEIDPPSKSADHESATLAMDSWSKAAARSFPADTGPSGAQQDNHATNQFSMKTKLPTEVAQKDHQEPLFVLTGG